MDRRRLLDRLDAPTAVVALVGPLGSGRRSLLRRWSSGSSDVAWTVDGALAGADADVLIVDDAERVADATWLEIATLLAQRPGLRVRIAARSARSLPQDWTTDIVRDLAFTAAEVDEYLARNGARVDARQVWAMTQGHARSVEVVARSGIGVLDQAWSLLSAVDPRAALTAAEAQLAVPAQLTPRAVVALGGDEDALERMERAGSGAWRQDVTLPVFVLTPIVRAATERAHPLPATRRSALHERAALALLDDGAWLGAVIEAQRIDRLDLVDRAVRGGGMPFITMHGPALRYALRDVPATRLRKYPLVAMALAIIHNARRQFSARAVELFGIALLGMRTSPRGSEDRALLRSLESIARRLIGVGDGGAGAARTAGPMLDELPSDALPGLRADLQAHLGVSLLNTVRSEDSAPRFEAALSASPRPAIELMALGGLALQATSSGDLPAGRRWIETATARPWPDAMVAEYPGSLLLAARAQVAMEEGSFDEADALLDRVWPIIDTIEHWRVLVNLRASIAWAAGRPEEGRYLLRALRAARGARYGGGRPHSRLLDTTDALLSLAVGDLEAARRIGARASDPVAVPLVEARVALADGDTAKALAVLGGVQPEAPSDRMRHAVLTAAVLHRIGRVEDARTQAASARTLGRVYGLSTPLQLAPPQESAALFGATPAEALAEPAPAPKLTPRESVVLAELLETASVAEIAARLHVSVNTVKSQRRSLYRKLSAGTREEAIAAALAYGVIGSPSATRSSTWAITGIEAKAATDAAANSSQ